MLFPTKTIIECKSINEKKRFVVNNTNLFVTISVTFFLICVVDDVISNIVNNWSLKLSIQKIQSSGDI